MWWSKARPDGAGKFEHVNTWSHESRSFENTDSLFPPVDEVYSDMRGRLFLHPTMHKPPWNFVTYGSR